MQVFSHGVAGAQAPDVAWQACFAPLCLLSCICVWLLLLWISVTSLHTRFSRLQRIAAVHVPLVACHTASLTELCDTFQVV